MMLKQFFRPLVLRTTTTTQKVTASTSSSSSIQLSTTTAKLYPCSQFGENNLFLTTTKTATAAAPRRRSLCTSSKEDLAIRDLFLSFAQHPETISDTTTSSSNNNNSNKPYLKVEDLRDLLLAIGDHPSEERLEQLINKVDTDQSGTITFDEFQKGCEIILNEDTTNNNDTNSDPHLDLDALISAFRMVDKDGNGILTSDELSGLFSTAGFSHLSTEEAAEIMSQADTDGSGAIDLSEFINLMTNNNNSNLSHKYGWRIRSGFRVFLVMGGPGSGKGTLCDFLVERAGVKHYSSGEMLREEIASNSPLAQTISNIMKEGKLVPSSTIIALLKKKIRRFPGSLVALDGFPRNEENYHDFDAVCGAPEFAVYIDVPDDVMVERILSRGKTSGRADDNMETAMKRLATFHEQTKPTLEILKKNKINVYRVDGTASPEKVWDQIVNDCPVIASRMRKNPNPL